MEKVKDVSIIIPIYNTGSKLHRCLDSVLGQSYENFECLMVDDGSTDDSPQIIDDYAATDSRFIAIHKANGGVSSARNEGLKKACGNWVVFLDSDDYFKPNHIEAMLTMSEEGIDIVFTGFEQVVAGDKIKNGHRYGNAIFRGKEAVASFLESTDALDFMIPWDRMYRRNVIEHTDVLFDTKLSLSEDRLFCYQYLLHAQGVATISEVTYVHDASDSNTLSFRFYPFDVNAYKHDVFVDATGKLLSFYSLSDHAIFLLWKYTWDLMLLTLSSLYGFPKNLFKISRLQKDFFQKHFGWNLYEMVRDTSEVIAFSQNKTFQIIFKQRFLQWNLVKTIDYLKYKLHISR